MPGLHVSNVSLKDMRMICFVAGSAVIGIADQVRDAIVTETGKSSQAASKQIWYVQ